MGPVFLMQDMTGQQSAVCSVPSFSLLEAPAFLHPQSCSGRQGPVPYALQVPCVCCQKDCPFGHGCSGFSSSVPHAAPDSPGLEICITVQPSEGAHAWQETSRGQGISGSAHVGVAGGLGLLFPSE